MMRRVVALTSIALALALPATVSANRRVQKAHSPIVVAERKARQLWGGTPCGGSIHVGLVDQFSTLIAAEAAWESPTGANAFTSPPSQWTSCRIVLRRDDWSAEAVAQSWPLLCSTVLHEWGHLTGYVHTDEPGAVNAPGVAPDTPEQAAVMLSGRGNYSDDLHRCGWRP